MTDETVQIEHFDFHLISARPKMSMENIGGYAFGVLSRDGREYWSGLSPISVTMAKLCREVHNGEPTKQARKELASFIAFLMSRTRDRIVMHLEGHEPKGGDALLREAKRGWPIYSTFRGVLEIYDDSGGDNGEGPVARVEYF